jgi:hypothetical protein
MAGPWVALGRRKRLERFRRERQKRRQERGLPASDDGAAEEEGGPATEAPPRSFCVVCMDRDADMVYPACGHLCLCHGCSPGVQRCPICRSRQPPIRVYSA